MQPCDPLDAYRDMLETESQENDKLLASDERDRLPVNLPSYLEDAALRYEAARRRYEEERGSREGAPRSAAPTS